MILQVKNLSKQFGGLKAVNDLSFSVEKNNITGLIGPNGAGKTTSFNCLTGTFPATSGTITFDDVDITRYKPHQIASLGMVRTFQQNKLFPELTVFENVLLGAERRMLAKPWEEILGLKKARLERKQIVEKVLDILEFTDLTTVKEYLGKNLAHGNQRRLAIAIALASDPKLLLLDEPATGMNPEETNDLMNLIKEISNRGIGILLIEHDMKLVMNICQYITVLCFGEKIAEGTPQEIASNQAVIEAYLGRGSKF